MTTYITVEESYAENLKGVFPNDLHDKWAVPSNNNNTPVHWSFLKALNWKLSILNEYRNSRLFKVNTNFIYKELTDKNFRAHNYMEYIEQRRSYIFNLIKNEFGVVFSDDTPFETLFEVFSERIYDTYDEFIPK